MATARQIDANRSNAKMSTGPRTAAGKARSRMNSWKHGLTAETLLIVGECADDFDALRAALLEEFDPPTVFEFELVERLAGILWRLRRVPFFEAAILDARAAQIASLESELRWDEEDEAAEEQEGEMSLGERSVQLGGALTRDSFYGDGIGKLGRHETSLMNSLTKTLQMLRELQSSRRELEVAAIEGAPECSRLRAA